MKATDASFGKSTSLVEDDKIAKGSKLRSSANDSDYSEEIEVELEVEGDDHFRVQNPASDGLGSL